MPDRDEDRPYTTYRSAPRGLVSRLRGESDAELEARADALYRRQQQTAGRGPELEDGWVRDGRGSRGKGNGGGPDGPGGPGRPGPYGGRDDRIRPPRRGLRRIPGFGPSRYPRMHPIRWLKRLVLLAVCWVLLSVVLFFISASGDAGNLPGGSATKAALSGAGPMLFTPNNILILGLDNRPTSGYSSKEGGANYDEADADTDSIMIWRLGGGVSRKLSIARDTLVDLPAPCGEQKINAAWSCGGPKLTIQTVEKLTGVKINHVIVVDLGNFAKFIDDIGGVTVEIPTKICSSISGGAADGGFSLTLNRGSHHLSGTEALTLARTRENSCDPAWDDFNRQKMQQEIVNGIKGQLFTLHAFFHLPWASWDAPKAIQTDMGPVQLMEMFISSEIGGSSAAETLTETGSSYNGEDVQIPSAANVESKVNQLLNGH
jgi:LCP family protein required for cell wall assembly